ncbi:F-box domain containing protein [Tanacetum coccineum]|uniref:F-box domain containing protein n=1 Tax=Tanacetum coccineum TaxID=301880 RepID=A0ABQ5EAY1_9ASTR
MNNSMKYYVADDSSSFSCLPDEIVLQILRKLVDFKTLCLCKLVSKRFERIVHQVETICFTSFTDPFADPLSKEVIPSYTLALLGSYLSAIKYLKDFGRVKYLLFSNKELYVNANGQEEEEEEEEDMELYCRKLDIALECFSDVDLKFRLLMNPITNFPLLQDVSITDPGQKDESVLCPFAKIACIMVHHEGSNSNLFGRNDLLNDDIDSFMKIDLNDFEDKEEVAYSEAVIEIVKKHRSRIILLYDYSSSKCYVLFVDLPVSGYVVEGVTLFLCEWDGLPEGNDGSMTIENLNVDVEDTDEATYSEDVKDNFKNRSGPMESRNIGIC